MTTVNAMNLAEIGNLVGDLTRAQMLTALLDGRALTAGELAWCAGIMPQTASSHLAKLQAAGLLTMEKQGRHRYFRLSSPTVAAMLESMQVVCAVDAPRRIRPESRMDKDMRMARSCYDHLAGVLGVALADALTRQGAVDLTADGGVVTAQGRNMLGSFGIDVAGLADQKRCFCRPCLDWSERRHHIAGALGKGLADRLFQLGWIKRVRDSRVIRVTPEGQQGLKQTFAIDHPV
ncbi:MAG TPA: transcriptional regulator [Rhodospirillaceae bacterium]|nr:transcriptional regulator [Magnetovibrio sp.]HBT42366.1 transcriptional regulator [Rhodospirillaceae bacterium]HCS71586.1 transcriptional regulator [Rhodospirillaceae bacterium]|tara:strand:- start:5104 stop:5805 length:702 start_codon:yes stop_codon:yes gene_type:complete